VYERFTHTERRLLEKGRYVRRMGVKVDRRGRCGRVVCSFCSQRRKELVNAAFGLIFFGPRIEGAGFMVQGCCLGFRVEV
jgi:hypothetical protein